MSQSRSHQFKLALFVAVATTATVVLANDYSFFPATVSGGVYDEDTNQPIRGAYVLAEYKESGGVMFAQSSSWCVRTKGVYTGTDGLYAFKYRGTRPTIHVIKPDYFFDGWQPDNPGFRHPGDGNNPLGDRQNLYLRRQDPAKPEWHNVVICERPTTRADVEANVEYMNILLREHIKLGVSKASIKNTEEIIDSLKARTEPAAQQAGM